MVNPADDVELSASEEQMQAWGFYGIPRGAKRAVGSKAPSQAVGEVRYVIGWMADQMVRMGWRVLIDESEDWTLALPDGERVTSNPEQDDADEPDHPANASRKILGAVGWDDQSTRLVTTNLFVAGELWYIAEQKAGAETWSCVSMIDAKLKDRVKAAGLGVRGLWPHPADSTSPDAPLFGVLGILDDMLWLTRLERSQSANRVGMRGIVGVSDELKIAGPNGGESENFYADFEAALTRPMDDPEDVGPVILRGATSLVKPEGDGMAGLSWLIPEFPYDERIDERLAKAVQRLAYGLPIPPELLLGMQAQSRATAFQVEEAGYRAHVEPAAWIVAQVPQDALAQVLPDVGAIQIVPDPTAILARRVTTQNAFDAFDRGAIGEDYLREVLGIPARAEPEATEAASEELPQDPAVTMAFQLIEKAPSLFSSVGLGEIIRQIQEVLDGNPEAAKVELPSEDEPPADDAPDAAPVEDDPATAAADEAVNAAVPMPPGEGDDAPPATETRDDTRLGEMLYRIDEQLLAELVAASELAVVKAQERIGAAIRSSKDMRAQIPADLSNDEVAVQVGADALGGLGIDASKIVPAAIASTLSWWRKRLARAQADTAAVLEQVGAPLEFSTNSATDSERELAEILTAAVFTPNALTAGTLRQVLMTAGS